MRVANFVQETTTSIAGTGGDGAVTLVGIAGSPRIANALGSGTRALRYTMQQTSTNYMEAGMGVVSGGVLTRSRPQVTWDGTTFKDGSGGVAVTPLPFGAAPTAGDVVIRIAPTAEDRAPGLDVRSSAVVAAGGVWRDFPISSHNHGFNAGGAVALATGIQYYTLYRCEVAGLLSGVQIEAMATAVNPSNVKIGLYDIGPDGMPAALLVAFNTFNTSTTGTKTDTATGTWVPSGGIWLTPGWYAIGVLADAAVPVRCGAGGLVTQRHSPFGSTSTYGQGYTLTVAQAYASGLQASFSGSPTWPSNSAGANTNNIWVGLKVTS